ncbi:MAG: DUF2975 domain-containing protein [Oscillospiraceae bacterium]|nr:DUF2975 domain-containing protein [Oscillospiraceae bacterium]
MREKLSDGVTRFTSGLLAVMFYGGIAATAALPWLFRWAGKYYPVLRRHYWLHTILFMLAGVGAVLIIRELRRMFRTVLAEDCFVRQNVVSLRRMGYLGLGIAAVTLVRLMVIFTPATLLIILVFFIAALFSFVLSRVFDQAVRYKEENDLTI